ncbi:hypothetical protein GTY41_23155 [Streptomyces sp. SID685]|uniref:hypothetical protein n=1 Tax=Streptomyces TaxID=1883 RepID=UPI00136E12F5|nr:hypothetical protein [Streptomyces sp. SID685]MYR87750.1 hypothetical protein [Streptomyces sp. SID685]
MKKKQIVAVRALLVSAVVAGAVAAGSSAACSAAVGATPVMAAMQATPSGATATDPSDDGFGWG